MILVDTSAWVEFDRGTGSLVERRLTDLVDKGGPVARASPREASSTA